LNSLRIHLIRHGQTDWNSEKRVQGQAESRLTPLGQEQAATLAPVLARDYKVSRVYCSSSVRTRQTAEILFQGLDTDIEYCDLLREIYLGPWEGHLQTDVRERFPEAFQHFWHEPHLFNLQDAETFEQVQKRALGRFEQIVQTHQSGDIALISHGVWIKTVLCALEPRPMSQLWEPPIMKNCAHSIVEITNGDARIIQYGRVVEP